MKTSTFSQFGCISDAEDRGRVAMLEPLFLVVKSAKGTGTQGVVMAECAVKAGMVTKTFQNQYYAWLKFGVMGCADKRKVAKVRAVPDILAVYKEYLEKFKGQKYFGSAAHRRMLADFRMGRIFRGVGTWREVFRAEFPERQIPPTCPVNWVPYGWSYANMMERLKNDATHLASLAWNVRGAGAASRFVQDVMRSRLDATTGKQLPGGSVYQWDDAFENHLVTCPGHVGFYRPVGFHCYDVGTGFHMPAFQKPRPYSHTDDIDRIAGSNLTEQMFAMAFFYVHAVIGFNRAGVLHVLENGTTAIRDVIRQRLQGLPEFGRLINFKTGMAKCDAAHKGLFLGRFGAPQTKSIVEGGHRYRQLEMADLPAPVGLSAAMKPESLEVFKDHEEKFLAQISEADIPEDVVRLFAKRHMNWDEFQVVSGVRSDMINDTTKHRLEGWGKDYHVDEFCDPDDPDKWYPMSVLDQMTPVTQERIEALMVADHEHMVRSRRMSRREAWNTWAGELVRVPLTEMWYFMDPRWAKVLTVSPKRTIRFSDEKFYGKGVDMVYEAKVTDANGAQKLLAPGQQVRVYFNCWGELQNHIWIADMNDNPLGMANRLKTAFWADPEQIKEAAKAKLIDMAEVLHDTRSRNWDAAAEKLALDTGRKLLIEAAKESEPARRAKSARVSVSAGAPAPALEDENPYAALS